MQAPPAVVDRRSPTQVQIDDMRAGLERRARLKLKEQGLPATLPNLDAFIAAVLIADLCTHEHVTAARMLRRLGR